MDISTEQNVLRYLIQWGEHEDIIICDIAHPSFERVTDYLIENIILRNPIYATLKIWREDDAYTMLKRYITHVLHTESSVMAITADCKELKGVGLLLLLTEEWRSWVCMQTYTDSQGIFNEVLNMNNILLKSAKQKLELDVYDCMSVQQFALEDYLFRDHIFLRKFFDAFCESARHMRAPRITYAAMSYRAQRILRDFGWTEVARVIYSIHKVKHERPFDVLRMVGELNSVLYQLDLPPVVPYMEMTGFEEIHRQILARAKFE